MGLLALETSSHFCSVALKWEGKIFEKHAYLPANHTQILLDWISCLLEQASCALNQLDAIAYSYGPGSFTGIRLSAAVVQGISLPWSIPIIGISSLQAIAQSIFREQKLQKVMIIDDAKMQEAYIGQYNLEQGMMVSLRKDYLSNYQEIALPPGEGWSLLTNLLEKQEVADLCQSKLFDRVICDYSPQARDVLFLAEKCIASNTDYSNCVMPVYLRTNQSWKKTTLY